jgi:hypothetical protein
MPHCGSFLLEIFFAMPWPINLLTAEVAYAISNPPKTIIQMQQLIIDLYLAESYSVHKN